MRAWVVLLMLLPALAAAEPAGGAEVAELDAVSADLSGVVEAGGVLRALVDARSVDAPDLEAPRLLLVAERVTVTVHERNSTQVLGATVLNDPVAGRPWSRTYTGATVQAVAARGVYEYGVLPVEGRPPPGFSAHGGCAHVEAPTGDSVGVTDRIDGTTPGESLDPGQDPYAAWVGDALGWAPCGGDLEVAGDLRLVLWGVDVHARGSEGGATYPSGEAYGEPPAPGVDASDVSRRQVVVTATNATLALAPPRDADPVAYVADASFRVAGTLAFQEVRGRVAAPDGWHAVDSPEVVLEGDLHGGMVPDPARGPWRVLLSGRLDAASGGGGLPTWGTATVAAPVPGVVGVAAGVAAGIGAVLLVLVLRRRGRGAVSRVAFRLRRRASEQATAGRFRAATLAATVAVRLEPTHGDGYVLRALARASRRRFAAALLDHLRAHHRLEGRPRALNAFEAARVCGLLGRAGEAGHWLSIAARLEPALLREASMDPDFGPVVADERFQRIVQGLLPGGAAVGA